MRTIFSGLVSIIFFHITLAQHSNINIPYYPNEEMCFCLKYLGVKMGEASLVFHLNDTETKAYICAEAKSTGLIKMVKNIHFKYEVDFDLKTGLPVVDSRRLCQGSYIDTNTTHYNFSLRNDSATIYSPITDTIIAPKEIYDLLTAFYMYRANYINNDIQDPFETIITTFFINEVRNLKFVYAGKETISTKYGYIQCLKLMPETLVGHFFSSDKAMCIWVSNDSRHIPIRFTLDFKLGTLKGELVRYKKPCQ